MIEVEDVISELESGLISFEDLSEYLHAHVQGMWIVSDPSVMISLQVLLAASEIDRGFPDSTVDIGITAKPLNEAKWFKTKASVLSRNFSCIAIFESGGLNIDPAELNEVIVISSGRPLHSAACALQDPWDYKESG